MQKFFTAVLLCLLFPALSWAQAPRFEQWFANRTLRVDYSFAGDARTQEISLSSLSSSPVWAGRRGNLDSLYLDGNGQITMRDEATGKTIYRTSFSTLFQEWQTTEEATRVRKAFENVFLLPYPLRPALVSVELRNNHRAVTARFTHRIDPEDILIRRTDSLPVAPHRYLLRSDAPERAIDIAVVAEGYTEAEMSVFMTDAQKAVDALFAHEPFRSYKARFNVVAVASASHDSGVSHPKAGLWKETAVGSHFDTFYSDRYLTTLRLQRLHDLLTGIPYEHIIVLANTDNYGGGGILNSYVLSMTHHPQFLPVVVHEFGHSFGGLADEYFYDDEYTPLYPSDTEPWEKNITTLVDFSAKWENMLPKGTKIPTPPNRKPADVYTKIGVYEGGGYRSKGVYRAFEECRMKTNESPEFCAVCQRALRELITYYTE